MWVYDRVNKLYSNIDFCIMFKMGRLSPFYVRINKNIILTIAEDIWMILFMMKFCSSSLRVMLAVCGKCCLWIVKKNEIYYKVNITKDQLNRAKQHATLCMKVKLLLRVRKINRNKKGCCFCTFLLCFCDNKGDPLIHDGCQCQSVCGLKWTSILSLFFLL